MDALVDVARINLAWREEVALLVDVQVGKDRSWVYMKSTPALASHTPPAN